MNESMNGHTQSGIYDLAQTPSGEIISRTSLTFSLMLESMSFLLTVPNRSSKGGLDFPLGSSEFYSCIQFEIRKRLAC